MDVQFCAIDPKVVQVVVAIAGIAFSEEQPEKALAKLVTAVKPRFPRNLVKLLQAAHPP